MRKRAEELNIQGVALVAHASGAAVTTWSSEMAVVGMMIRPVSATKPATNLLAIVYSKAAEMADTLEHSGNGSRPPLFGDMGLAAEESPGKNGELARRVQRRTPEDDAKVSQAGLDVFAGRL